MLSQIQGYSREDHGILGRAEDAAHHLNLAALLFRIRLIYTYSIDPESVPELCLLELLEHAEAISRGIHNFPVDEHRLGGFSLTP